MCDMFQMFQLAFVLKRKGDLKGRPAMGVLRHDFVHEKKLKCICFHTPRERKGEILLTE